MKVIIKHTFKKWFGILLSIILITGIIGAGLCASAPSTHIENKMPEINTYGDRQNLNFTVGVARCAIDIPDSFFPEKGFVGVHDKLYTKTLLMDNGTGRIAFVVIDLTSLLDSDQLKEIVSREGDVDPANIFICASHTFSAPHAMPAFMVRPEEDKTKNNMLQQAINDSISKSVTDAKKNMQPAKIGYGTGSCNVNVNRDMLTAEGWWHGSNDHGISDKDAAVIKFEDLKGNPLAVLMNYAVQSSIMSESIMKNGGKLVSSDLGGAAAHYVEQQYNNQIVALFTTGAAGDQEPLLTACRYIVDKNGRSARTDIHDDGYVLVDLLGERLGSEAVRVSEQIHSVQSQIPLLIVKDSVRCQSQIMPSHIMDIHPTKKYNYQSNGEIDVPIEIMQIGDIVLVGVQPELACKIGIDIKQKSPFKNTIIMTMVNGAAKYMADAESYDNITYESMNSNFAKGSAEIVENKIISMLNQLNNLGKNSK